jgi:hypothetical protein
MIQTGDARARTVAWGERNDPLLRLLNSLTVRLTGTVRSGKRGGASFTGTGVIVRVQNAVTHVVTAKHNLHVAGTGTGTAPGDLADLFRRNVRVESATAPVVTSEITSIRLVDGDPENQGYDVAVLRLTNPALADAVRALGTRVPGALSSPRWGRGPEIVELLPLDEAGTLLANGASLSDRQHGTSYEDAQPFKADHDLVQLGYGRVGPGREFRFGYRVLPANTLRDTRYVPRSGEGLEELFTFATTAEDTGLEGDSGGPVFAVDKQAKRAALVGVYCGANFFPDRVDDSDAITNNAITIVDTARIGALT